MISLVISRRGWWGREAGGKTINDFPSDFPPGLVVDGDRREKKIQNSKIFKKSKFPKFPTVTTTTGRSLGRPIFNIIVNT